jgi:hypothetical protein
MQTKSWPWSSLELEPGADERSVRRAYARILKQQRPDADPDAFQRLRSAYESALTLTQNATKDAVAGSTSTPADDDVAIAILPLTATTAAESAPAIMLTATASHDVATAQAEIGAETLRLDPAQEAIQRWQIFIADPMHYRSSHDVSKLFDEVVNFQVRDELEWQALLHCLHDNTPSRLRVHLSDALEWRLNHKHLVKRDANVANAALARAFADEDYETLSQRYPAAIALLEDREAMRKRMKSIVIDAELEREMNALIASLNHYYQNVRRIRIDANLIALWQKRQSLRTRITGWVLPLMLQSLWFGVLVAAASTMRAKTDSDWNGPWDALQIALAFVGMITYLLVPSVISTLTPMQQAGVRALRGKTWVRYGWIAPWLVTVAMSLATGPSGTGANVAVVVLAVCTAWASVAYGLLPIARLLLTPLTYAVGLGFVGHWAGVDRPLWILAVAHGVLIVYFLHFARKPLRAMAIERPRLIMGMCVAWFLATVTFLMLLQTGELHANRYAWALFSLMIPFASGIMSDKVWSKTGDIPFPLRHLLFIVYWWTVGLVNPNLAASFALLVACIPVVVEMKRVRVATKREVV